MRNKKGDLIAIPSPFSWSAANCRIERTVLVMQKVLCKMFLTKHKITLKYPEEMDLLRKALSVMLERYRQTAIIYPREAWLGLSYQTNPYMGELHSVTTPILRKIEKDKKLASLRDPFDLWAILRLLSGFLFHRLDLVTKATFKGPVENYPEDRVKSSCQRHRPRPTEFNLGPGS